MEFCDRNHDQICFEVAVCPMCEMREEKEGEILDLQKLLNRCEEEVSSLKEEASD